MQSATFILIYFNKRLNGAIKRLICELREKGTTFTWINGIDFSAKIALKYEILSQESPIVVLTKADYKYKLSCSYCIVFFNKFTSANILTPSTYIRFAYPVKYWCGISAVT